MKKRIIPFVSLTFLLALISGCATQPPANAPDLFHLAGNGTLQQIQTAIMQGAKVNARDPYYGATPLIAAATFNQNPEVITTLLKAGADVNVKDISGETALMYAAGNNPNPDVIDMLLKAGADIKARDSAEHQTALIYAAWENRSPEVIATLVNAGADINAKDRYTMTALMWAAEYNPNPEVVRVLLKAGANAKEKNLDGMTAFDLAYINEKLKGTDAYQELQEASQ
jgi:ankyrin repeat protein